MSVAQLTYLPGPAEPSATRAQRLMAEARIAADDHVRQLERALVLVAQLSGEVAGGGDVYPPGVRDISKKLHDDAGWCAQTLDSIMTHVTGLREPNFPPR